MTYYIYKHTTPDGRCYIGQTINPKQRWTASSYQGCSKFFKAICKYGWDNIEHTIIATCDTEQEADKIERKMIEEYDSCNNGFNTNAGGRSGKNNYFNNNVSSMLVKQNCRDKNYDDGVFNLFINSKKYDRTFCEFINLIDEEINEEYTPKLSYSCTVDNDKYWHLVKEELFRFNNLWADEFAQFKAELDNAEKVKQTVLKPGFKYKEKKTSRVDILMRPSLYIKLKSLSREYNTSVNDLISQVLENVIDNGMI